MGALVYNLLRYVCQNIVFSFPRTLLQCYLHNKPKLFVLVDLGSNLCFSAVPTATAPVFIFIDAGYRYDRPLPSLHPPLPHSLSHFIFLSLTPIIHLSLEKDHKY